MNERDKNLKHSVVVFFIILILFSFTEPIHCEQQSVQIGQWAIDSGTFYMDDNPVCGTSARNNDDIIYISVYKNPEEYKIQSNGVEVEIPGTKDAIFSVYKPLFERQQMEDSLEEELIHSLVLIFNQQKFVFIQTVIYTRESGTLENKAEFVEECIKNALPKASSDNLILFAKLFFGKEIKLGQNRTNNTYPVIEASIDNGGYIELKNSKSHKEDRYGWSLPAKPGQNVKFRIQLDTYEITATTYGITMKYGREFSQGRKISIDGKQSIFNSSGIAELDYGNLDGPELLILRYQGWKDSSSQFNGNIYLRWGRPEEEWLDNNEFPLAEKVTNPTLNNCIGSLLHDLNIAYDWDRNCWITYRGEQRMEYQPDYSDINALEGLDLKEFSYLQKIIENSNIEAAGTTIDKVRNELNTLLDRATGEILWQELTRFNERDSSGWHSPSRVFNLVYLYKEFAELRHDNPIEKVLDFWAENIKKNPDPVGYYTKGGMSYTDDLNLRAYAIAALNLGYELFKKPEYKEACDAQIKRFREFFQEKGFLDSIINLEGWKDKTFGFTTDRDRQMCEAVSLYGQVCALIGDEEGLKQTQDWIKSALKRDGTQGQNAFRNYETATFKDRCGFIAILRGKAAFSELPLKKDVLLK